MNLLEEEIGDRHGERDIILCMIKREAEFQTKFGRWLKYMWPKDRSSHFELKVARTGSLPFSAVSKKQKTNLKIAQKWFYHKYSDFSGFGTAFDCTFVGPADCYVVVQYLKPKNKEFFVCPIDSFLEEEQRGDRRSLTEERARAICRTFVFP